MTQIETDKFIVSACMEDGTKYLAIDRNSGGYSYWSDYFHSAEQFTQEEANRWIEDFKTQALKAPEPSSDGVLRPHHEVCSLLELNDKRTKAQAVVRVERLIRSPVSETIISGEIKKPKGFVY
jgi:hypothetical protein